MPSASTLLLLLLLHLLATQTTAAPTPSTPSTTCTTQTPDALQIFSEANPTTAFPNLAHSGGHFLVAADASPDSGPHNRVAQAVAFAAIPPGSWGCTLHLLFPAAALLIIQGAPQLDVSVLGPGPAAALLAAAAAAAGPSTLTWDDLKEAAGTPSPLFGSVGALDLTAAHTINSLDCPTGGGDGGDLAFLFTMAASVTADAALYFNTLETSSVEGAYLTYNC